MQVSSRATGPNELEGRTLGPYQIMEMVGRGGMAVVYKARQTALQRFVAIKVLPPYFVHDPSFEDRFQQEAATVARLDHPNILTIFDYGQEGGYSYIVMPLVAGGTLRHWINHAEPLERLVTALSRILGALQYAHSRRPGVVHRDIKPSNVLMREDGWPLLGDFGIAKIIEPTLRVTNSSAVIGTPEYMAPEQCLADGLDHRADLYAMGVILFEILTRRLPYGGAKSFEVMYQQVNAPVPSVRTVDPSLTVAWDEVIQRSLAKNPADRYPSAAAMDEAVQAAWLETQTGRRSFVTGTTSSIAELHRDARAALRGGDWQRVIRLCGRILESDPTDVAANRSLTQAHQSLRRQSATALVQRADSALLADRLAEARAGYEGAPELVPGLIQAESGLQRVQQADRLARQRRLVQADVAAQRWDSAAAKLDELASLGPDRRDVAELRTVVADRQSESRLATWYESGVAAMGRGDWSAAVAAFQRVVAEAPGYRDASARLAGLLAAYEAGRAREHPQAWPGLGRLPHRGRWLKALAARTADSHAARGALARRRAQLGGSLTVESRGLAPTPPEPTLRANHPGQASAAQGRGILTIGRWALLDRGRLTATAGVGDGRSDAAVTAATGRSTAAKAGRGDRPIKLLLAGGLPLLLVAAPAVIGLPRQDRAAWPPPASRAEASAGPTDAAASVTAATVSPTEAAPAETWEPAVAPTWEPTAADVFAACEDALAATRWIAADAACERTRELDPDYPGLRGALVKARAALGYANLLAEDLVGAEREFQRAMAADPTDGEVVEQLMLLRAYRAADTALSDEDWPLAAEQLETVYEVDPQYLAGTPENGVAEKLFAARLGWGRALLDTGLYEEAEQRCQKALDIKPEDEDAAACQATALAALAPPPQLAIAGSALGQRPAESLSQRPVSAPIQWSAPAARAAVASVAQPASALAPPSAPAEEPAAPPVQQPAPAFVQASAPAVWPAAPPIQQPAPVLVQPVPVLWPAVPAVQQPASAPAQPAAPAQRPAAPQAQRPEPARESHGRHR